ncbi:hypothetical protein B0H13DRAFT_2300952 [Mycena leptocephala]|nr:hypothetical protein B0H13DRAFT_2300952 [Mycena leptocephala]
MRDFAQELIDKVMNDCSAGPGGAAALKACGLVCKRWLPRSRYHVFSRIILDADNLPLFIDIVDSSSLPILSFVQHLTLSYIRPLDDALLAKTYCCPNLKGVDARLSDPVDGAIDQFYPSLKVHIPFWAANSPLFSRLDLTYKGQYIELDVVTILDITSFIPSLEYLAISGCYILCHDSALPTAHSLSPRWHTLEMNVLGADVLLRSLLLPTPPALRSLKFGPNSMVDMGMLQQFCSRAGGELDFLGIGFRNGFKEEVETVDRLVRSAPKLRNLQVSILRVTPVLRILSVLPAYAWNTITLVLWDLGSPDIPPWAAIDLALANPRLRALKLFSFHKVALNRSASDTYDTVSMITPETRCLMPLADARGILA